MSAGTRTSAARSPLFCTCTSHPSARMRAPIAASMRSVWSRESSGSQTTVSPSAPSAARMSALLTCALATLVSTRQPCRRAGRTSTGARPPSVAMSAPKRRSGAATRSIGREEREASPVSRTCTPRPAASPISRRMVVPLLPQSSEASRNVSAPQMCMRSPSVSTVAPSARIHAAVERQSSPRRAPVISASPSATALNMIARWVIDLSPGMENSPVKFVLGNIFMQALRRSPRQNRYNLRRSV